MVHDAWYCLRVPVGPGHRDAYREVASEVLNASGPVLNTPGFAVFTRRYRAQMSGEADEERRLYFSPAAARTMVRLLARFEATPCDKPELVDLTAMLVGPRPERESA